jgi:hypothetical protein
MLRFRQKHRHQSKWCKLPLAVKINNTSTCWLTLDFYWLVAYFLVVATDLIILLYAVLTRTLGKLVLKNVNQVHFCTTILSLRGLYFTILENINRKEKAINVAFHVILCWSMIAMLLCRQLVSWGYPGGFNLSGNGIQILSFGAQCKKIDNI